uniref:Uncharacterized protein n=1 Tax=Pinctada fucata TaxID=50426 RepID=A0A194ANH6_PINFU
MRVLIFLILLYMQYCAGHDILYNQLMNEMQEIRRTVKILETNLEQQRILTETHEKRIAVLQDVVASHEIELDTVKRELEVVKKRQNEDTERERIAVVAKSTNYSEETRKARKERETDINVLRRTQYSISWRTSNILCLYVKANDRHRRSSSTHIRRC